MENSEAILKLEELTHTDLLGNSHEFAYSLLNGKYGYNTKGSLSEKQWFHVHKLVKQVVTPELDMFPRENTEKVGDFAGVIALFNKAKEKLKWPKITVETECGLTVQFSMAGAKAKKPGTINVTDGKPFGENVWYGRVEADGTWEKSHKAIDEIGLVLNALSTDPAGFATTYGKKTGHCCFCNKHLKTDNSVAAGFGPVCADNFGLKEEWKQAAK